MLRDGGSPKEALRPDFNRSILVDFQGAKGGHFYTAVYNFPLSSKPAPK